MEVKRRREEGFQAWVRGKAPYIVATAALGTGIDIAGIIHVIHLEAPFSIIDYAQEAGRAGRTGEPIIAKVIIEDKDWPDEDATGEAYLDISVREDAHALETLESALEEVKGLGKMGCRIYWMFSGIEEARHI
ncbi:P-loop containing nucleoside triphosphate hydrolase protein [Fusarium avenaceum]|nr:P-loop containing nucleoside triphosphate hydrolase protein [Fusarium avenaceum]